VGGPGGSLRSRISENPEGRAPSSTQAQQRAPPRSNFEAENESRMGAGSGSGSGQREGSSGLQVDGGGDDRDGGRKRTASGKS